MSVSYKSLLLAGVAAAGWMMYSAPASACPAPPTDPPVEAFGGLFNTINGCAPPYNPIDPNDPPPSNPPPNNPPPPSEPRPCGGPPTLVQSIAAAVGLPIAQPTLCAPPYEPPTNPY